MTSAEPTLDDIAVYFADLARHQFETRADCHFFTATTLRSFSRKEYKRLAKSMFLEIGDRLVLPALPHSFPSQMRAGVVSQTSYKTSLAANYQAQREKDANHRSWISSILTLTEQIDKINRDVKAVDETYSATCATVCVNTIEELDEAKERLSDFYGTRVWFGIDPKTVPNQIIIFIQHRDASPVGLEEMAAPAVAESI